ncbi:hypothetical protein UB46_17090 [Burkholderiaceae bacterium 16]|nr:hypothetical protein UB46_17090 [Burkholderiaceae bacterium 16]
MSPWALAVSMARAFSPFLHFGLFFSIGDAPPFGLGGVFGSLVMTYHMVVKAKKSYRYLRPLLMYG